MAKAIVSRAEAAERIAADWGGLTWYASGKLGNSAELTVGKCSILPGRENPLHWHPNCSETLVVTAGRPPAKGTLEHAWQVTRIFEAFAAGPGRTIALEPAAAG